jgi:hypothetical protein
VGTSGVYGGSGNAPWSTARDRFDSIPAATGPAAGGDGSPGAPPPPGSPGDAALGAAASAIADALAREDYGLVRVNPRLLPVASLLPRTAGGRGGGGGEAGGTGERGGSSRASGRLGDRSKRSSSRAIQRGGAALAAAYALQQLNSAALQELNLSLDELQSLGPRQQCMLILQTILGDSNHPDEQALKKAAAEQLKAILVSGQPPTPLIAIQDFIAAYVFELGLLEIRSQRRAGVLNTAAAIAKERDLKDWIRARVRSIPWPFADVMPATEIRAAAARIASQAIRILRAGGATA